MEAESIPILGWCSLSSASADGRRGRVRGLLTRDELARQDIKNVNTFYTCSRPPQATLKLAWVCLATHGVGGNVCGGTAVKKRDLFLLVIAIGLLIGLAIVNVAAASEVAHFFDQLVVAGVVASAIVRLFFM